MPMWQPPGTPYTQASAPGLAAEMSNDSLRSMHGIYYPPIHPPVFVPPPQPSYQNADAYTYVDQVGHVQTVPVVSRRQVLREIHSKQSTSISGAQLQEGADASSQRLNSSSRARSNTATRTNPLASRLAARESVLQWLVPSTQQHYPALWTSLFTLSACFVFAFMAGNFALYQQSPTYKSYNGDGHMPLQMQWGPQSLLQWLKFWQVSPSNVFDVGYLMSWGARYLPAIRDGEWWRLFSSICLHGSFAHLFSNMLVFVVLAVPLEHSYGLIRIFAIFIASGFGGNFLSMAFEDPCFVYVGASGAVFGFIGLYLTDILLNFETMYKPLLRLFLMLVALGLTLGIDFSAAARNPLQRVSHMSHIGGLVAGLFVSFMFIPNLADRRWKAARKFAARVSTTLHTRLSFGGGPATGPLPLSGQEEGQSCWRRNAWLYYLVWAVSVLVMLFMFVGLPVYVYTIRIPSLQCKSLLQS